MYDSVYDKVNNENTHTKLTPISTAESVSLLLLTFLILRLRVVQSFCHSETDFIYDSILIFLGFFSSGINLVKLIHRRPFFKVAPTTSMSSANLNCRLKERWAIPLKSLPSSFVSDDSCIIVKVFSCTSTSMSLSSSPARAISIL